MIQTLNSRPPTIGSATPWGPADFVTKLHDGVYSVSTTSHGGFWISPERLTELRTNAPNLLAETTFYPRSTPQWFEEDCECARVVAGLDCFSEADRAHALKYLPFTKGGAS